MDKWFGKWKNILFKLMSRHNSSKWRRVFLGVSVLVVFAVTYALVLPAITIDKETTDNTPGMSVESVGDGSSEDCTEAYGAGDSKQGEEAAEEKNTAAKTDVDSDEESTSKEDAVKSGESADEDKSDDIDKEDNNEQNDKEKVSDDKDDADSDSDQEEEGSGESTTAGVKEDDSSTSAHKQESTQASSARFTAAAKDNSYSVTVLGDEDSGLTAAQNMHVKELGSKNDIYKEYKAKIKKELEKENKGEAGQKGKDADEADSKGAGEKENGKKLVLKELRLYAIDFSDSKGRMIPLEGDARITYRFNHSLNAAKTDEVRAFERLEDEDTDDKDTDDEDPSDKDITDNDTENKAVNQDAASGDEESLWIDKVKDERVGEYVRAVSYIITKDGLTGIAIIGEEEEPDSTAINNSEETTEEEEVYKAGTLTAEGDDYKVTVTYEEGAKIPEGASLDVSEIKKGTKEYDKYLKQTKDAISDQESKKVEDMGARFFDITIKVGDKEIQPSEPVKVEILTDPVKVENAEDIKAVHFEEKGKEKEAEVLDVNTDEGKKGVESVTFDGESFSVYGVIYTVDFHWEVNGKKFEFSIPGGGYMSFRELIEMIGIADKDETSDKVDPEEISSELTLGDVEVSEETRQFVEDVENVEFSSPDLLYVGKVDEETTVRAIKQERNLNCEYSLELTLDQMDEINDTIVESGDWALISIRAFLTEEQLIVTMKNGDVFMIKVTDASGDAPVVNGQVQTIPNPSGTHIDLFDYWIVDATKDSTARDAWPDYGNYEYIDYGNNSGIWLNGTGTNKGINSRTGDSHGHALKFTPANAGTVADGTINNWGSASVDSTKQDWPWQLTGGLNSWTHGATPRTGIVEGTLDNNYPILTNNGNLGTNGESLQYLFDVEYNHAGKESFDGTNNLLYVDPDGYYTFDSNDYNASFNKINKTFSLAAQTSDLGENRGFWPFGNKKYWLGMHMHTDFSMPADGKVLSPKAVNNDMIFEFQGDDDTWLYVDGVLVGDGGGVHNQTLIRINFRTGTAYVTGKEDAKPDYKTNYEVTDYLDNLYTAAGKYDDYEWVQAKDDDGNIIYHPNNSNDPRSGQPVMTFAQGSNHKFDMFYLERGGGESNLRIHYNLISTTDFSAHKSYHTQDNARLERNAFKFELIGFDNMDYDGGFVQAIMPDNGTSTGAETFESPKKVHKEATADMPAHTSLILGVTEDGNVNFGDVDVSSSYAGKQYKYMVREIVPPDAVNADGVRWDRASDEVKAEGGFVKNNITYDGRVYYFIGTVEETSPNSGKYKLKKTRFLDPDYQQPDTDTKFFSFVNGYVRPLTLKILKKDANDEDTLLTGAQFSLTRAMKNTDGKWTYRQYQTNAGIVQSQTVSRTTSQGVLTFNNLTEGHYILEETAAPSGYELTSPSKWLLTLTKQDSANTIDLIPTIQALNADGEATGSVRSLDLDQQNNIAEYEILNQPKQIQLTLDKEWLGRAPADTDVTFVLKRYKAYEKPGTSLDCKLNVYRVPTDNNNNYNLDGKVRLFEGYFKGDTSATVRFTYDYYMGSEWKNGSYKLDDMQLKNGTPYTTENNTTGFAASVYLPVGGEVNMYIGDGNMGSYWPEHQIRLPNDPTGTPATNTVTEPESVTELDSGFSQSYTFPAGTTSWTHVFDAYPAAGHNETYNVSESYTYFIEEEPEVSGYDVSYDRMDGEDIAGSTDSETRVIRNMRRTDVPVVKSWKWSEDDADQVGRWDARFLLEYREVLVSGTPDPNAKTRWAPVIDNNQVQRSVTISSTENSATDVFTNLPMYQVHDNGSVYRLIYAVDEVEYNLYRNGENTPYKSWNKATSGHSGAYYSPDYEQDAGELDEPEDVSEWGDWYTIRLTNAESNRETLDTIDLSLQKIWEGDSDNSISDNPDNYAKFRLKRYYHEEFLDLTANNLDPDNPVTVKLDLKNGKDPIELSVPRNAPVYITGMVKPENSANLSFKKTGGSDSLSLTYDNSTSIEQRFITTASFTADNNVVWEYNEGDASAIVGGKEGIRLASFDTKGNSYDVTNEQPDNAFNRSLPDGQVAGQEFTLDVENRWAKDWVNLPHVIVEEIVSENHTIRKTIVYSYYLEEISSNPDNFAAVFKDGSDNQVGDFNNPISYNTSIIAENVESTQATVTKVWNDNNDAAHKRPTSLTVTLMADGGSTGRTVTLSEDNQWTETIEDLPKYNDGVEIDYYWHEGNMPAGYFLTGSSVNGTITTLTNSLSDYDLWTDYSGTKTWEDENNKYNTRPNELVVTLYESKALVNQDGSVQTDNSGNIIYGQPTATPYHAEWDTEATPWTYTFDHLPIFDENGNVIKYSAEETTPGSYTPESDQTPTVYTLGEIWTDDGKRYLEQRETESVLEWQLSSMIDLPFVVVKNTNGRQAYIWSPRVPTPAEKKAIINFVKTLNGWHIPNPAENTTWYVSATTIENPGHGNVTVTFDPENLMAKLTFAEHDNWAQFIIGQFKLSEGQTKYNIGTTEFTNTLQTTSLSGTKTWNIEGVTNPPNPILKLTRTVTTSDGDNHEVTSEPELVTVQAGGENVPLQPEWSGEGLTRNFTYSGLPEYDRDGNKYTYSVAEASFVIGSGEDAVTYTTVRSADGTYTVTASKEDAAPLSVIQTGNSIVNSAVHVDVEFTKVEKGFKDDEHILKGASFQLTRVNENNDNAYTGPGAYQSEVQWVNTQTGKVIFTGLVPGRYKLEEVDAPSGYIKVESPWFFTIDDHGKATLEDTYTMASPAENDNAFYIENESGAALPSTGGFGTQIFTILGSMLVLAAGVLLLRRRRLL